MHVVPRMKRRGVIGRCSSLVTEQSNMHKRRRMDGHTWGDAEPRASRTCCMYKGSMQMLIDSGADMHVCPTNYHIGCRLDGHDNDVDILDVQGRRIPSPGKHRVVLEVDGHAMTLDMRVCASVSQPILSLGLL